MLIFYIALWMSIVWECASFWVLFDAFRRIKRLTHEAGLKIETKMVRIHLLSYGVYLLSMVFLFASLLNYPKLTLIVTTNLYAFALFCAQFCLVLIFN